MKRPLLLLALSAFLGGLCFADDVVPDQVIVKFRHGAARPSLSFQAAPMKTFGIGKATEKARKFTEALEDFAVIQLSPGTSVDQAVAALRSRSDVEYAGPNPIVHAQAPNDTFYSSTQWALNNTGQTVNGNAGSIDADIDAAEAWTVTTGSSSVIVAVVDGSVDYTHPDLAANMWHNPAEIPNNGIDDDNNGIVDDYYGANFVRVSGPPTGDPGSDGYFHGTHVAGTIGAVTNNAAGVAGICWNVRIMALRFLDSGGTGSVTNAVEAIQYATAHNVSVINNSWAVASNDVLLHAAITAAKNAGIVITAAAGNDANSSSLYYPAAWDEVIAVSETTNQDHVVPLNYGLHIDVGAPGRDIASTTPSGGYGLSSGTSMAAPHVAGVAALMRSLSSSITPDQVLTTIRASVDVPSSWETESTAAKWYGAGRLNAYNAVRSVGDATAPTVLLTSPSAGTILNGTVSLTANASDNAVLMKVWFMVDGVVVSTDTSSLFSASWNSASVSDGSHTITARAFDGAGNISDSSLAVTVGNGDTVPPTVSVTSPAGGAVVQGTVNVNVSATDNVGIGKVWFFLDGVHVSTDSTFPYSWAFDTLTVANGGHTIDVKSFDTIGNSSATSVFVTVNNPDISSPTVSITYPSPNGQVAGTISMTATASDNVGVSSVQFLVDGAVVVTDVSSPFSGAINTTLYSTGAHTLGVRAFDAAGNSSSSTVAVTFVNDVTSPSVAVTAPASGATLYGSFQLSATASDNIAVSTVAFTIDGVFLASSTVAPYATTLSTVNHSSGTHVLSARAFDTSGNTAVSSVTVTFSATAPDGTAPRISATGFETGARLSGIVDLTANASDDVNVSRVELRIDGRLVDTLTAGPFVFHLDTASYGTGAHTAVLTAYDAAGNSSSTTLTFTVASFAVGAFQPLFNPVRGESVTIPLNLGESMHVEARLLDRFGALVATLADGDLGTGAVLRWDGRTESHDVAASGTYYLYLKLGSSVETRKIILRK